MASINRFLQKHDIDKSDIGIYKTLYKFYCLTEEEKKMWWGNHNPLHIIKSIQTRVQFLNHLQIFFYPLHYQ